MADACACEVSEKSGLEADLSGLDGLTKVAGMEDADNDEEFEVIEDDENVIFGNSLPSGEYSICPGVTVWMLERNESSGFRACVPLTTQCRIDGQHHSRFVREVHNAPESGYDWVVLMVGASYLLARTDDIQGCS